MRITRVVFGIVLIVVSIFVLSGCASMERRGMDAYIAGNYQEAIKYYKACVDEEGDTGKFASDCSFMIGRLYFDKHQYQEAIVYLKRAIDVYKEGMDNPPNALSYCWLGKAYYENKQYKEAIIYFDKGGCYSWLGYAYYSNGQYQEAVGALKKAIELHPTEEDYYRVMSLAYGKLKQYDEAIASAKRSIEIKPNKFAYSALATIYTDEKQYDEAIAACKKAIELDPKNLSNYYELSNIYDAKEDFDNAIAINKKAQELAPENTNILFDIAWLYMKAGKFDNAIESLNKAIALETITGIGTNIAIEDNYPVVKGLTDNAPAMRAGIQVGDRIIEINGQSTKGWTIDKFIQNARGVEGTQVALTIERKGKKIEKTLKRETMISKSAAPFFAERSLAYRQKGMLEDAYKDAEKAYSLNPDNGWVKSAISISYIDKGRYDDALNILSTIKDSPFDRILEATAYAKLGNMKKAVEIYSSIPEDYLALKSVLRKSYKNALLETLKPYVNAKKDTAKSLEAKGQYREALNEYAEALKVADDRDTKEIRTRIAAIVKKNPYLSQIPEEARKYALRGEVLIKDGNFEGALKEFNTAIKIAPYAAVIYRTTALVYGELKEYAQAINYMNAYLELMSDAPDVRAVKDQIYKWEFMLEKERGGK